MNLTPRRRRAALRVAFLFALCSLPLAVTIARTPVPGESLPIAKALPVRHSGGVDDSLRRTPPADLTLDPSGIRKADALATFVEGARLEENGELEAALIAYQKVLTVHPGEVEDELRYLVAVLRG